MKPPPAPSIPYGEHPLQVANLHLPACEGRSPVMVLLHGGFWRNGWDRTLMTPLARDLAERGIAAWNVEFRRVGDSGGGWPGTFLDVAAAIDHLRNVDAIDANRVVACGHSAGGHLALWVGARAKLPDGAPGCRPAITVRGVVAQAPVADLGGGWETGFGRKEMAAFLGGAPTQEPERYDLADPIRLAPLGMPQLLVHGTADDVVPIAQSHAYITSGDGEAQLLEVERAGHFDVIEPQHEAWHAVVARLPSLFGLAT